MKFQTLIQEEGSEPILEVHDLNLVPNTLESARLWTQAYVDEYNRYSKPEVKKLTLISVTELPALRKTG